MIDWLAHATRFHFHTASPDGCFGPGPGCFMIEKGIGWTVENDLDQALTKTLVFVDKPPRPWVGPEYVEFARSARFETKEEAFEALRSWWMASQAADAPCAWDPVAGDGR